MSAALLASAPAIAAPKGGAAKKEFDRGVAAYKAKDYAAASEALGKSFGLEADVETLYAWAQSERQLNNCEKAIELYEKLLKFDLPDANRKAVGDKLEECKALVVVTKDDPEPPKPDPVKPTPEPVRNDPVPPSPEGRAWWKNPVGGTLVGLGVVGLGVGGYFLVSARGADQDAKSATNYFDVEAANAKADSHGRNGVIGVAVGGALILGGIVWYATRGQSKSERTTVTGWVAPSGGGVAALGRF